MAAPLKHVAIKLKYSGGWTLKTMFMSQDSLGKQNSSLRARRGRSGRTQRPTQQAAQGRNPVSGRSRGGESLCSSGRSPGLFTAPFEMAASSTGTRSKFWLCYFLKLENSHDIRSC